MTWIIVCGIIALAVLIGVGIWALNNAGGAPIVPQGLNNPNAGARTPLTTDAAIRRNYHVTEWTTPTGHYVNYEKGQTRRTERHTSETDTTTSNAKTGAKRHVKGTTVDEVVDVGW